ncbi:hypothetical protein GCM10023166_26420 [Paeniglutamicibacter cryotolerans]
MVPGGHGSGGDGVLDLLYDPFIGADRHGRGEIRRQEFGLSVGLVVAVCGTVLCPHDTGAP